MNPIDWIAWVHGRFFIGQPIWGYLLAVVSGAALFLVVWARGVDRYRELHPQTTQADSGIKASSDVAVDMAPLKPPLVTVTSTPNPPPLKTGTGKTSDSPKPTPAVVSERHVLVDASIADGEITLNITNNSESALSNPAVSIEGFERWSDRQKRWVDVLYGATGGVTYFQPFIVGRFGGELVADATFPVSMSLEKLLVSHEVRQLVNGRIGKWRATVDVSLVQDGFHFFCFEIDSDNKVKMLNCGLVK